MTAPTQGPAGEPTTPPTPKQPKRSVDPEDMRAHLRFTGWILLAILLAWSALQLPLPYSIAAIPAGLSGVVLGIVLFIRCIRQKLPALIWPLAIVTVLGCGFFALSAGMQVIFWEQTAAFEACIDSAVTDRAISGCYTDYEQSIYSRLTGG